MLENIVKKTPILVQIEKEINNNTVDKITFSKDVPLHYIIWSNTLVLFPSEKRTIKDTKEELNNIPTDNILAINILFEIIHLVKKKVKKLPFKNYIREVQIPSVRRSVLKNEKGGKPNYVKKETNKLYIIPNWTFWKIWVVEEFKKNEEISFIEWYEIDISIFSNERIARCLYKMVCMDKKELKEKFSIYKEIIFLELSK